MTNEKEEKARDVQSRLEQDSRIITRQRLDRSAYGGRSASDCDNHTGSNHLQTLCDHDHPTPPNRLLKHDLLPAPQDLDKERLNKPKSSTEKEAAARAKKQL